MSKYNPEGSLSIIDELEGYSGATNTNEAYPNWYSSKVKTVPDNPPHQVLQISQTKLAEVLPRKKYIIDKSAAYPRSELNLKSSSKEKLEQISISKFDTKVNNNKLEAINPDKEVNYVSRDSSKAWYSVIWDYVCCCKKSSVSKTKILIKNSSSFFDQDYNINNDHFVDIKSSLLGKNDPESQDSVCIVGTTDIITN